MASFFENQRIAKDSMSIPKQSALFDSPQALLKVADNVLRTFSRRNIIAQNELDKARRAWRKYQSTRRRDAVYSYLSEVFTTVRRWKQQDMVRVKVHQTLAATQQQITIRNREPFGVVLFCTSNADTKTRSKWSKALRFAERSISSVDNIPKFMKRHGGINECANRF